MQASEVEPFIGIDASYNLTNPKFESGTPNLGEGDVEFDKEINPGLYAGVVLSEHHRLKLGFMDKGFAGLDVYRYYTAYDYLYSLSDRLNLTAGVMVGYDDFVDADDYSDMATGLQIGAEYRMRDFSVELGYQLSANLYQSDMEHSHNTNYDENNRLPDGSLVSESGRGEFADDNMLYLRLNYYF